MGQVKIDFIFSINTKLDSVIPLYFNALVVLGIFVYWVFRHDATVMLRRSLIIGGIGGFFYTFVDQGLVNMWAITYLREDIKIFATPLSVVLTLVYCIAIAISVEHAVPCQFLEQQPVVIPAGGEGLFILWNIIIK